MWLEDGFYTVTTTSGKHTKLSPVSRFGSGTKKTGMSKKESYCCTEPQKLDQVAENAEAQATLRIALKRGKTPEGRAHVSVSDVQSKTSEILIKEIKTPRSSPSSERKY